MVFFEMISVFVILVFDMFCVRYWSILVLCFVSGLRDLVLVVVGVELWMCWMSMDVMWGESELVLLYIFCMFVMIFLVFEFLSRQLEVLVLSMGSMVLLLLSVVIVSICI